MQPNNERKDELFSDDDIIFTYTIAQAEEDGILVNLGTVNASWKAGPFSHMTTNLLSKGYEDEEGNLNIPCLQDLLSQAHQIVQRKSQQFTVQDWFYSGRIELPSGTKQEIFIVQNETGKHTLMLPEDY